MSEIKQRSEAWFKQRIGMVTGSRVGAILGHSPFSTRADIMEEMIREHQGIAKVFQGNAATQYGSFHEDLATADLELLHALNVKEVGFVKHPTIEWLGASPDGIIDDETVIEIKCPYGKRNDKTPEFKTAAEQPHYYAQMQVEMICTERTKCLFYQWSNHGDSLETVEVDAFWIADSIPKLHAFYDEYIERRDLPLDLADTDAENWLKAKAEYEAAKAKLDAAKEVLIEKANGEKAKFGAVLVYPIERKGSIQYSKIVKQFLPELDLAEWTGKPSVSWAVK